MESWPQCPYIQQLMQYRHIFTTKWIDKCKQIWLTPILFTFFLVLHAAFWFFLFHLWKMVICKVFWLFQGPLIPAAFTNGYHWAALRFRIFPLFSDPKFGPHRQLQLWLRHHNQICTCTFTFILCILITYLILSTRWAVTTCCCICLVFAIRAFLPARPLPTYSNCLLLCLLLFY